MTISTCSKGDFTLKVLAVGGLPLPAAPALESTSEDGTVSTYSTTSPYSMVSTSQHHTSD
jgi:hypothetical protein